MLNVEMESSALFVVARLRGLRAGMVCAVSANLVTGDVVYGAPNPRLHTGLGAEHRGRPGGGSPARALTWSRSISIPTWKGACGSRRRPSSPRAVGVEPPGGSWDEALVMRVPSDLTVFLAHVAAAYPLLGSHHALCPGGVRGGRRMRPPTAAASTSSASARSRTSDRASTSMR